MHFVFASPCEIQERICQRLAHSYSLTAGAIAMAAFVIDIPDSGYTSPILDQVVANVTATSTPGNVTDSVPFPFSP